ncbi:cytochrome C assembly family protein [Neisseria sp. Ec49-e6-T10]|uniref:cytochrome C assembly family protein n=1 Tax=Neisseria sp. Ec49-e6-T10 TaxID=3140744 RepID=UPI003EBD41C5
MGLFLVLLGIYTGLSAYVVYFWQKKSTHAYPLTKEHCILGITLVLQTVWVWQHLMHNQRLLLGFSSALNLITWIMLIWYWFSSFFLKLQGLQLLLFPLTVITLLISYFFPGTPIAYLHDNLPFLVHIVVSILAYSLFGIAALLALLLWRLSYDLHHRKNSTLIRFLPPLLSLEKIMFQMIWVGFALLTLSVLSGALFSEHVFGHPIKWSHKAVFGIISWLTYAALLFGRVKYHWRGKTASRFVLIGFVFLMLAYMGSKFVLEFILHR